MQTATRMHHLWWDVFAIRHHLEQLRKASEKRLRLVACCAKQTVIFSVASSEWSCSRNCVISKIKPDFWGFPHLHGIGGTTYQWASMSYMLKPCQEVKKRLKPGVPFGVDLLIPKIGGGARATNKDRLSTFNIFQRQTVLDKSRVSIERTTPMEIYLKWQTSWLKKVRMSFCRSWRGWIVSREHLWRQVSKVTKVQSTSEAGLMHDGSLCHLMLRSG